MKVHEKGAGHFRITEDLGQILLGLGRFLFNSRQIDFNNNLHKQTSQDIL